MAAMLDFLMGGMRMPGHSNRPDVLRAESNLPRRDDQDHLFDENHRLWREEKEAFRSTLKPGRKTQD